MDKTKKLDLIKHAQERQVQREQKIQQRFTDLLDEFSRILSKGVDLNGADNLRVFSERMDVFTEKTADTIRRLSDLCETLDELRIPDTLEVKTVADERILSHLDRLGDNGEIEAKLVQLDSTLQRAVDNLKKSKLPTDYQPVRIVIGSGDDLRFLTDLSFPVFSPAASSSSSTVTVWALNDTEETATYKYFGFETADGTWKITRKTLASNAYRYATGDSNYSTAWSNRASHSYVIFGSAF